uniref:Palmitoyltransferase n=1 Tax=Catagonus wagneri TaxID=51154 RepID=A0A8C3YP32_9CETA
MLSWAGTTEMDPAAHAPRVWFVLDALGLVCATATWLLVMSEGVVLLCAWLLPVRHPAYSLVHGSLFYLLAFLALASHARTMLTDPGALPAGAPARPGPTPGGPHCPLCGAIQPPGAHHCSVCERCIRGMDHHCPWVNNCVGEDNRKFFLLFTLYTALAALHLLLLLGVPALRAYALGEWNLRTTVQPRGSLVFLFLVALKGFLFAAVMFTVQIHTILTDRTGIEPPQRQRGAPGLVSPWMNLKAVLGHRPSPAWISPFASPEPRAMSLQL